MSNMLKTVVAKREFRTKSKINKRANDHIAHLRNISYNKQDRVSKGHRLTDEKKIISISLSKKKLKVLHLNKFAFPFR